MARSKQVRTDEYGSVVRDGKGRPVVDELPRGGGVYDHQHRKHFGLFESVANFGKRGTR